MQKSSSVIELGSIKNMRRKPCTACMIVYGCALGMNTSTGVVATITSFDCSTQGIGSDNFTGKLLLLRSILKVIFSVLP